ncbi:PP2C family protein-serine/threonine phosphatase [Paracoccus aminophilus]|uniref:PP2C family protein-serine/threonine phosphatase n=1 Tax=Paracoccus aminophilus TaxID=34003 RepID=UPI0004148E97|nr:fused response regulator/phosphatase [Paracoccus aminophilus]
MLLADTSTGQRRMLAVQLLRANYRVAEAASLEEAKAVLTCCDPDIVISDWYLAGGSGLDLCRELRGSGRTSYSFFILLTSKSTKEDLAAGLQAGADEFLTKPISGAELFARLSVAERILTMEARLRRTNTELQQAVDRLNDAQTAMNLDLRDARVLQQRLIRERTGQFGDFHISLLLRPAGHIGGDMVGFFPINGRRIGAYALDVSGHGVTAALLTARLAAQLSDASDQNLALRMSEYGLYDACAPIELMTLLNRQMLDELRTDAYYTMAYADLDYLTGQVRLVQAGHPHPVVQRADGRIERIGRGGLPVGVVKDAQFEEICLHLAPGDRLLLASDGITDCENPAGQPLGDEGLTAILRTNARVHGPGFLESLSWSLSNYINSSRVDDMSAVLIERALPGSAAPAVS